MNRQQTIGKSKILLMQGIMLLIATLAFAITPTQTAFAETSTSAWYGDGTADSYEISTVAELQELAELVNNGDDTFSGKTITLKNDIDLNSGYTFEFDSDTGLIEIYKDGGEVIYAGTGIVGAADGNDTFDSTSGSFYSKDGTETNQPDDLLEWTAIGYYTSREDYSYFQGTFDGGGYTISGLYMNSDDDYMGLFGDVEGTIQNLTVDGIVCGEQYVGGIVGYLENGGGIYNCTNKATVIATYGAVGGIVGYAYDSTIENCYNTGDITGSSNVGGIAGYCYSSTINECYNIGDVAEKGTDGTYFGGIAGYSDGSTISNCYAKCNVSGTDAVGGLIGCSFDGNVSSCYYSGNAQLLFGGLQSKNSAGSYTDCYFVGDNHTDNILIGTYAPTSSPTIDSEANLKNVAIVPVAYATENQVSCTAYETAFVAATNGNSAYYTVLQNLGTADKPADGTTYTSSLVSLLNGNNEETVWAVDTKNTNSGYPILLALVADEEVSGGSSNSRNITISSQYTVGGAEEEETPEPEVTVTPTVTPTVAPTAEPTVQPTATPVEIPDATEAEETSNGYIAWIIIGILALAAVGYVIYKKKQ